MLTEGCVYEEGTACEQMTRASNQDIAFTKKTCFDDMIGADRTMGFVFFGRGVTDVPRNWAGVQEGNDLLRVRQLLGLIATGRLSWRTQYIHGPRSLDNQ